MARMAMMGRHSVDYHRRTLGIGAPDRSGLDVDVEAEVSAALRYYSSHGETPLVWGGSGAEALGLVGAVLPAQYEALFAEGGAIDPTTGARLVRTQRPGMEIVVSAQKSVAELGVIGRAPDMHAILSAETDATLAYLDKITRTGGGRRGRAAVASATEGLIYVRTRHATSRAGDPSPHDHVLFANAVSMADARGGFKAPDTTVWRDHLHAATMVGRMASAALAIELGYGITPDPGPSGRLGHWRIAGIPDAVMDTHSKRGDEIAAKMAEGGFVSFRAKEIAANQTRPRKRHEPIDDLMVRWHGELAEAGYPVAVLSQMVDEAGRSRKLAPLSWESVRLMIDTALGPEGSLGRRKVFSRADAIVAIAPGLYGQDPGVLDHVVDRLIADPEVIPLLGVSGARQRVYTTAVTLATEAAIAGAISAQMARVDAPAVSAATVAKALTRAEEELGRALTAGQEALVSAATTSGRGAELVVGIAGSGKTAGLRVVADAFSSEGFTVIGTATSGQAARTLGREAGIGVSRTLASIKWRLAHGQLVLTDRHVVILDEVGATDDPALLSLLWAAERARAKVVMVGDWRQLGPVGPGGAFEALLRRHKDAVAVLSENVRQRDPTEAGTLLALRSGSVTDAVEWYASAGRLRTAPTRTEAVEAAVAAWAEDLSSGRDAILLAWRRANVAALNTAAREVMADAGRLSGPELVVDGRGFRAGDCVVTLAPLAGGELVTSQWAVVAGVDLYNAAITLRSEDGAIVSLTRDDLGPSRLDYGYATTVHRAQGATTTRAHLLADGGGRELAYVGMSRAREASFAYVVADDVDQAREDLVREWSSLRRPRWAIDLGTPGTDEGPSPVLEAEGLRRLALRRAYVAAQLSAIRAAAPDGLAKEIAEATNALRSLEADRNNLDHGTGRYRDTEIGMAQAHVSAEQARMWGLNRALSFDRPGLFERRRLRAELAPTRAALERAQGRLAEVVEPERVRLDLEAEKLGARLGQLRGRSATDAAWLARHPEAHQRVYRLQTELGQLGRAIENRRRGLEGREPIQGPVEAMLARPAPRQRSLSQRPDHPRPERGHGLSL